MASLAHLGSHAGPLAPGEAISHWSGDPLVLAGLLGMVAIYAIVWHRARLGGSGALTGRHAAAFAAGWLALVLALATPLEALAGTLLSLHMAQHVLLIAVAAPLLALGLPVARMSRALPGVARRPASRLRAAMVGGGFIVAALLVHVAVIWVWHAPALYEAALTSSALHGLEHLAFLASAMLVWWSLFAFGSVHRPRGSQVAALFVIGAQGAALGALMTFAAVPWYASYEPGAALTGVDALADQQIAGLVMWGAGGIAPVVVAALLLVAWLKRLDRYPPAMAPPRR